MAPKQKISTTTVTFTSEDFAAIGEHFQKLAEIFGGASRTVGSVAETPKKAVKDPFAPKRPVSSYILFCNDYREKIKLLEPTLSSQDVSKRMGELWNGISDEEKKKYEEMSLGLRAKYNEDLSNYNNLKSAVENLEDATVAALVATNASNPSASMPGYQKIAPNSETSFAAIAAPSKPAAATSAAKKSNKTKASTEVAEKPLKKKKASNAPVTPQKTANITSADDNDPNSAKKKKKTKKDTKKN
ncbi:High mobility group protein B3 [Smittium culicis]|uniref:High mobility group protein B3 n=2 Tax=Smittium culicis TaxID=133412 RepID=A0A1R1XVR0_9FUNG|nr:High mobility group protein B3 [Smittium culicis]